MLEMLASSSQFSSESIESSNCSLEIAIGSSSEATGDVGVNPAPIVIEIVVDVGNSQLGCRWSRGLTVGDREGEVDVAIKSSDGMNSQPSDV